MDITAELTPEQQEIIADPATTKYLVAGRR